MRFIALALLLDSAAIVAQAGGDLGAGALGTAVAQLGAVGVLGWYAWHTASRTLPNLLSEYRAERREERLSFERMLAEKREQFAQILADETEQFRGILAEQRAAHERQIEMLTQSLDGLAGRLAATGR
jgi:hypothetical protein